MSLPEASVIITILIFVGGLVFQAGKQSNQIDSLDVWRTNAQSDVKALLASVAHLESMSKTRRS